MPFVPTPPEYVRMCASQNHYSRTYCSDMKHKDQNGKQQNFCDYEGRETECPEYEKAKEYIRSTENESESPEYEQPKE